ncbi:MULTISPECIES: carboxypeptidase-like regulatory domain-containing protein [Achromobacter]|uniref:Carboxypeptidase regulatory-like domain-containing protein n=1 Tax=Alcaligenes xylosoxydans xylosoxydans TaxID=85698 RepID=A0A424WHE6_ALCXX|nr:MULTISPECIES: carboxypeptidase-like regulatory domain-containing protein [Achromobacter]MBC9904336.1 carboxypeptidase regulatory-like domain-containing protein [Achromobacter xylosoxidans]MBD0868951.1 carboxypeptidase regulatory-like domain-containing protein [Achromobacter xylosoxidans]MDH1303113.1 carboxypeptidase-like regulatory domain-containing protein [Achromobacter sp. GD03932]QNP88716.1 carboxypeptidase regulatory-like domain-containing protein [Achromobacter xylosoxidans]RPJ92589.1
MNKRIERCTMAAAMALGSMAFAGILSTAQAGMPPVQQQGSVQYVSGGIGLDESEAMKAAAKDYPLALTFAAQRDGQADYVANVSVTISDAHGKSVLQTTAEGPYMLVKLPAGNYKISATYNGQAQNRNVAVQNTGTARAVFEWK